MIKNKQHPVAKNLDFFWAPKIPTESESENTDQIKKRKPCWGKIKNVEIKINSGGKLLKTSNRSKFINNQIQRPDTKADQKITEDVLKYSQDVRCQDIIDEWNKIKGVKPTQKFRCKKVTNTFKIMILAIKAFYNKTIYKEQGIIVSSKKRIQVIRPKFFDTLQIEYSYNSLIKYIQNFDRVLNDPCIEPKDKKWVKGKDLALFLLGRTNDRSQATSPLLRYCTGELKMAFKDPNPEATACFIDKYHTYIDKSKEFSPKELELLSKIADKIDHFADDNPIPLHTASRHFGVFFQSLENFRPAGINYFLSKHCWDKFRKKFSGFGYLMGNC